jgi:hypothetical protein
MPYEDPKFISELLVVNPADTDQRSQGALTMRGIKNAIVGTGTVDAGSFTPNATGQYTGTMDEIQFATDNAIPTDMATTPPVADDLLRFDGNDWVPASVLSTPAIEASLYSGLDGQVNDEIYFTTAEEGIDGGTIATVKNNGDAGNGWLLTALVRCQVSIAYSLQHNNSTASYDTEQHTISRDINGVPLILDSWRMAVTTQNATTKRFTGNMSASVVLEVGQTLSMIVKKGSNVVAAYSSVSVQAVA